MAKLSNIFQKGLNLLKIIRVSLIINNIIKLLENIYVLEIILLIKNEMILVDIKKDLSIKYINSKGRVETKLS